MADERDRGSDEELIAAANRGDGHAFELLYERYRDWVYALALRFTGDRDLALDVMQETFTYFLQKFPGFELTARLKTYLYPVVRHTSIAAASRRRRAAGEPAALESFLAPIQHSTDADDLADLARALAALPDGQREVLILRFADDLALREIALALGVPLGTVKSRLHLALQTLAS